MPYQCFFFIIYNNSWHAEEGVLKSTFNTAYLCEAWA